MLQGGDGDRSLTAFINGLRGAAGRELEYVSEQVPSLKEDLEGGTHRQKAEAALKLAYVRQQLGYIPPAWESFGLVEILTFPSVALKRAGYLSVCCAGFSSETPAALLILNPLRRDLLSGNPAQVAAALNCAAELCTADIAAHLHSEIATLFMSGAVSMKIRSRALLCYARLAASHPAAVPDAHQRLREALLQSSLAPADDEDVAFSVAALSAATHLAASAPQLAAQFVDFAPAAYSLLRDKRSNWVTLESLRLLRLLCPHEPRLAPKLLPVIEGQLAQAEPELAKSVELELLALIVHALPARWSAGEEAIRRIFFSYVKSTDQNLVTLGLDLLATAAGSPDGDWLALVKGFLGDSDAAGLQEVLQYVASTDGLAQTAAFRLMRCVLTPALFPVACAGLQALALAPNASPRSRRLYFSAVLALGRENGYELVPPAELPSYLAVLTDVARHEASAEAGGSFALAASGSAAESLGESRGSGGEQVDFAAGSAAGGGCTAAGGGGAAAGGAGATAGCAAAAAGVAGGSAAPGARPAPSVIREAIAQLCELGAGKGRGRADVVRSAATLLWADACCVPRLLNFVGSGASLLASRDQPIAPLAAREIRAAAPDVATPAEFAEACAERCVEIAAARGAESADLAAVALFAGLRCAVAARGEGHAAGAAGAVGAASDPLFAAVESGAQAALAAASAGGREAFSQCVFTVMARVLQSGKLGVGAGLEPARVGEGKSGAEGAFSAEPFTTPYGQQLAGELTFKRPAAASAAAPPPNLHVKSRRFWRQVGGDEGMQVFASMERVAGDNPRSFTLVVSFRCQAVGGAEAAHGGSGSETPQFEGCKIVLRATGGAENGGNSHPVCALPPFQARSPRVLLRLPVAKTGPVFTELGFDFFYGAGGGFPLSLGVPLTTFLSPLPMSQDAWRHFDSISFAAAMHVFRREASVAPPAAGRDLAAVVAETAQLLHLHCCEVKPAGTAVHGERPEAAEDAAADAAPEEDAAADAAAGGALAAAIFSGVLEQEDGAPDSRAPEAAVSDIVPPHLRHIVAVRVALESGGAGTPVAARVAARSFDASLAEILCEATLETLTRLLETEPAERSI